MIKKIIRKIKERFCLPVVVRWLAWKWSDFKWGLFVSRGTKCRECADGYFYPMYGLAPHNHNIEKAGGFIGSTEIQNRNKWPDNFSEDIEAPGCGVWYCPNPKCKNSINHGRL